MYETSLSRRAAGHAVAQSVRRRDVLLEAHSVRRKVHPAAACARMCVQEKINESSLKRTSVKQAAIRENYSIRPEPQADYTVRV